MATRGVTSVISRQGAPWKMVARSVALSTPELLKVRRCVKHLISHAEVKAAALDLNISSTLFSRAALSFTRSGSVSRLPESLLLRLSKLVQQDSDRYKPEPKRQSVAKHRARLAKMKTLQKPVIDIGKGQKNSIVPSLGNVAHNGVVLESFQEFSTDLEELCRQEVTQLLIQRARELSDYRDKIRAQKEEERITILAEKNAKLLKKALKKGDEVTVKKILDSGTLPKIQRIVGAPIEIVDPSQPAHESTHNSEYFDALGSAEQTAESFVVNNKSSAVVPVSKDSASASGVLVAHADEEARVPMIHDDDDKEVTRGGEVEIVSMMGKTWGQSRQGQTFEYLAFLDELETEKTKIYSPLYYAEMLRDRKLSEDHHDQVRALLGGSLHDSRDIPDLDKHDTMTKNSETLPEMELDFSAICASFNRRASARTRGRKSKLPRSRLN